MTTATITNPKSGKEYTLVIHNDKAIGCSCNQKKALEAYSPFAACKHMKSYNAPKPVAVADQFPTLDSCECCGRLIKKGMVICGSCLGY